MRRNTRGKGRESRTALNLWASALRYIMWVPRWGTLLYLMSVETQNLPEFEDIVETMSYLPDMDAKYQFLIDLSKRLAPLGDGEQTDDYRVWGCQSMVWIVPFRDEDSPEILRFRGKSDSVLVSGIIATVLSLYQGKSPEEILKLEAQPELKRLDLESHLSPTRRNGLMGMIERIREYAVAAIEQGA